MSNFIDNILHTPKQSYVFEIGVFTMEGKLEEKAQMSPNLAQILFFNENGTAHIPSRPVLQKTIEWAKDSGSLKEAVDRALHEYIHHDFELKFFEAELEKYCIELENYAKRLIRKNDGTFQKNATATMIYKMKKHLGSKVSAKKMKDLINSGAYKSYNHPLFDTGRLTRSIKCRLVKK